VFENPAWYTSYTPYQAEIAQGRLEALFNFQTMISELTGLPLTNASLLDEATAAAEAVHMLYQLRSPQQIATGADTLLVDKEILPSTLAVLETRCAGLGIHLEIGSYANFTPSKAHFAALITYPNADGSVEDYAPFIRRMQATGIRVAMGADLLALCLLKSPGSLGADVAFGSAQRFGLPMGWGGPSAGFLAAREEYKRVLPGRIVGLSKDKSGRPAFRLALQMREQHIKREKATSNICTSTALMAIMAGFYAVYHGYEGLTSIAKRVHGMASYLSDALSVYGYQNENASFFDTLKLVLPAGVTQERIRTLAVDYEVNLRYFDTGEVGLSLDETTDTDDLDVLLDIFATAADNQPAFTANEAFSAIQSLDESLLREDRFLQQAVFRKYRSETSMMRYIKWLERKDISLIHSMIPLGSCTMKLNAASEMMAASLPGFLKVHPYAPADQVKGSLELMTSMQQLLCRITGLAACSLQPNAGAAGEYAGLVTIRTFFKEQGELQRDTILIPASAHGTNPSSAALAGFRIVQVDCDEKGTIDLSDWTSKAATAGRQLAGCMITYPSTNGLFEGAIKQLINIIHEQGGLVYLDGANMNAQVGLTSPAAIGVDICHLNLHKTFGMPHGGGGPGMGPVCCTSQLAPYLPGHPFLNNPRPAVASAPYGHALLVPISYGYLRMLGEEGLKAPTEIAILNANYLAEALHPYFPVLYRGDKGRVAHEVIVDCRPFKHTGVTETDIAKRLMDFGFHAPTLSFPVHGTLMIEPTESESLEELDRFVDAMICIYQEIKEIEQGLVDPADNVLLQAPHAMYELTADTWPHAYSRQKAGYPLPWLTENKFQLPVGRIDNAYGDRHLCCGWTV
jgi:glycine dehydrogenase